MTTAMPLPFITMQGIRRHYDRVAAEITPTPAGVSLPSRIHQLGGHRQALRTSCGLNPRIKGAGVQPVQVRVHGGEESN